MVCASCARCALTFQQGEQQRVMSSSTPTHLRSEGQILILAVENAMCSPVLLSSLLAKALSPEKALLDPRSSSGWRDSSPPPGMTWLLGCVILGRRGGKPSGPLLLKPFQISWNHCITPERLWVHVWLQPLSLSWGTWISSAISWWIWRYQWYLQV